jgi:hypothetical protein
MQRNYSVIAAEAAALIGPSTAQLSPSADSADPALALDASQLHVDVAFVRQPDNLSELRRGAFRSTPRSHSASNDEGVVARAPIKNSSDGRAPWQRTHWSPPTRIGNHSVDSIDPDAALESTESWRLNSVSVDEDAFSRRS